MCATVEERSLEYLVCITLVSCKDIMTIIKGSLDLLSLSLNAPMILRVAVSLKYPNPYDNFALSLLKVSKFQMQIIFYSALAILPIAANSNR